MAESLFDRLGGAESVFRIVNRMYDLVLTDEELSPFFRNVETERLRKMQFEFIASALGGPVAYSGAELQAVHQGRGITAHHFEKFVGHLATAMEEHDASPQDVDEMLGQIALSKDRIVGDSNVDG